MVAQDGSAKVAFKIQQYDLITNFIYIELLITLGDDTKPTSSIDALIEFLVAERVAIAFFPNFFLEIFLFVTVCVSVNIEHQFYICLRINFIFVCAEGELNFSLRIWQMFWRYLVAGLTSVFLGF